MTDPFETAYWVLVRRKAHLVGSDGCTLVSQLYRDCCLEHDVHYRTGRTVFGARITRKEADRRFRLCMQRRSPLGKFGPIPYIRWAAVRLGGWWAWQSNRTREQVAERRILDALRSKPPL